MQEDCTRKARCGRDECRRRRRPRSACASPTLDPYDALCVPFDGQRFFLPPCHSLVRSSCGASSAAARRQAARREVAQSGANAWSHHRTHLLQLTDMQETRTRTRNNESSRPGGARRGRTRRVGRAAAHSSLPPRLPRRQHRSDPSHHRAQCRARSCCARLAWWRRRQRAAAAASRLRRGSPPRHAQRSHAPSRRRHPLRPCRHARLGCVDADECERSDAVGWRRTHAVAAAATQSARRARQRKTSTVGAQTDIWGTKGAPLPPNPHLALTPVRSERMGRGGGKASKRPSEIRRFCRRKYQVERTSGFSFNLRTGA
jgi:hypothetical protein